MAGGGSQVLLALSADLEVAHRAYLKSLGAAGFEVVTFSSADELVSRASEDAAIIVVGAATGLSGMSGLELLRRLGQIQPTPTAPVLLLHGATAGIDSPLKVLRKWSEARQELGLDAPRPKPGTHMASPKQPLVKLKSIDPTLELATPKGTHLPGAIGEPGPPEPPPSADAVGEILLTEADRLDEPDATDEVEGPPAFLRAQGARLDQRSGTGEEPDATEEVEGPPSFDFSPEPPSTPPPTPMASPSPPEAPPLAPLEAPTTAEALLPLRKGRSAMVVVVVVVLLALLGVGIFIGVRVGLGGGGGGGGGSIVLVTADAGVVAEPPPIPPIDDGGLAETPEASPAPEADLAPATVADGAPATVADGGDAAPETTDANAATAVPTELGDELPAALVLPLRFGRNSMDARVTDRRMIRQIAKMLIAEPRARVELVGYSSTDERESMQTRIGLLRARSARDIISARGPSRRRFSTHSGGVGSPAPGAAGDAALESARHVVMRVSRR